MALQLISSQNLLNSLARKMAPSQAHSCFPEKVTLSFGSILSLLLINFVSWIWQDRHHVWTHCFKWFNNFLWLCFRASMIGQLFTRPSNLSRILYFFYEFNNNDSLCASKILSSLVRQCLHAQSYLSPLISSGKFASGFITWSKRIRYLIEGRAAGDC